MNKNAHILEDTGGSTERSLEAMLENDDVGGIADMLCFGDDTLVGINRERKREREVTFLHDLCRKFEKVQGTEKEDDLWDACVAIVKRGHVENVDSETVLHVAAKTGWADFVVYLRIFKSKRSPPPTE